MQINLTRSRASRRTRIGQPVVEQLGNSFRRRPFVGWSGGRPSRFVTPPIEPRARTISRCVVGRNDGLGGFTTRVRGDDEATKGTLRTDGSVTCAADRSTGASLVGGIERREGKAAATEDVGGCGAEETLTGIRAGIGSFPVKGRPSGFTMRRGRARCQRDRRSVLGRSRGIDRSASTSELSGTAMGRASYLGVERPSNRVQRRRLLAIIWTERNSGTGG